VVDQDITVGLVGGNSMTWVSDGWGIISMTWVSDGWGIISMTWVSDGWGFELCDARPCRQEIINDKSDIILLINFSKTITTKI